MLNPDKTIASRIRAVADNGHMPLTLGVRLRGLTTEVEILEAELAMLREFADERVADGQNAARASGGPR